MSVKDSGQDVVLVGARFPRELYQQLEELARLNMRSVGRECVFWCAAALRDREAGKQERRPDHQQLSTGGYYVEKSDRCKLSNTQ